jgi:hypothetical protein
MRITFNRFNQLVWMDRTSARDGLRQGPSVAKTRSCESVMFLTQIDLTSDRTFLNETIEQNSNLALTATLTMGVWPLGRTEILVRCLFPFGATGRYYLSFIPRCLPLLLFPDDFPPPFSHRTPSIRSCCSPTRRRCSSCPNRATKSFQPSCKLTNSCRSIAEKVWLSGNKREENEFEASKHCCYSHHG